MKRKIIINTNITLRHLQENDAETIFELIDSQREYLGKWLPFVEATKKLEDTIAAMTSLINKDNPTFAILYDRKFIGLIGFKSTDFQNKQTEIGYWLSKDHQGKGVMTSAVSALCYYAFDEMGMNRVVIQCAVGNTPSSNIPKRLDFKFEGIAREGEKCNDGSFYDIEVYSKLKND